MRKPRELVVSLVLLLVAACSGPIAPPGTTQPGQPTPSATSTGASPSPTPTATATATQGQPTPSTTLDQPTPTATASDAVPPTPSATPEYALVFHSADGVVTVEAPDGAVPPGTTISVGTRPAEQTPPELASAGISRTCYVLEPEGTTFTKPVKVTVTRPRNFYGDANNVPLLTLATRTAQGAWEWLSEAAFWLTTETMAIAGLTDHFSCLFDWSDRTQIIVDPAAPRTDHVGGSFTRTVEAKSKDARVHEINFTNVDFYNYDPAVIMVGPDTTGTPSAPKTIVSRVWTCLSAGDYTVDFRATVNAFAVDNPFWRRLDLGENPGTTNVVLKGKCVDEGAGTVDAACMRVHHEALDPNFVSFIEFLLWISGYDVDYVEVVVLGANDDKPAQLDSVNSHFSGDLGLHNAGPKMLSKAVLHLKNGGSVDITQEVGDLLGDIFVQYPDENTVGECR